QILPAQGAIGMGELLAEGCREPDAAEPGLNVGAVDRLDMLDLRAERPFKSPGERHNAVLVALSFPHHDLAAREVDILHTEPAGLEQSEAGAVHQLGHEARDARHSV